ncbi:unnamed protein product [Gordionus sp. m RMFG-2023]|uniref:endothelial differentiation-related factor 1 homolog n=1 Tax=Gordionus sp. m RMFG-2023 TaxID=3053472 RepID=UPI0030DEDC0F
MSYLQSNIGWDDVVVLRKPQQGNELKSQKAIKEAQRKGVPVDTAKKYAAGTNKQKSVDKNTLKLEQDTENLQHEKVPLELGKIISKRRVEMNMTQKDLATKICEKPQIVNEYESGKAIPNQQIISKMERILSMKLRGKDKGKLIAPPTTNIQTTKK